MARPLETGWLADTPIDDNLLRMFLHNQGEVNEAVALAAGGRVERTDDVFLADTSGHVPYLNQALLLRPLRGPDDPVLDLVDRFFEPAFGRPHTLLSIWPTPDIAGRWSFAGHPAFVMRACPPAPTPMPDGVEVLIADTPSRLRDVERVLIDGYPIEEARDAPSGAVFGPDLLRSGTRFRIGLLDGLPAAAGGCHIAHGVNNLCVAATLPGARRRGVWEALVWARLGDAPDLPAVAYTSDYSRPGFRRMGFWPLTRFTLWFSTGS